MGATRSFPCFVARTSTSFSISMANDWVNHMIKWDQLIPFSKEDHPQILDGKVSVKFRKISRSTEFQVKNSECSFFTLIVSLL